MEFNPVDLMPEYKGEYEVGFTDGSMQLLLLKGFVQDVSGRPIYLYGEDGKVYNFSNVIYTRKRERNV